MKLILTVPNGFDVRTFCNVATAVVRDSQNEYDRRDYDYDLGDYVSPHYAAGDTVYDLGDGVYIMPMSALIEKAQKPAPHRVAYAVDAEWVDMAHIEALEKLQDICPEVQFYIEG